ncbi:MAG: MotA/TolQ/ExbB proton channel family protein [Myxococcales bacterium]|nr:MotA/TolQ/ExbB proton channel family protein [Myxococcales bacterium]
MLEASLETLLGYAKQGGFVMPPLIAATFVLWYALGYRFLTLQRGAVRSVRALMGRHEQGKVIAPRGVISQAVLLGYNVADAHPVNLRRALDDAFAPLDTDIKRGKVLITSIVAVAPLAGLLGTVTGMIETFDSLSDMALFSQSGGIAGGISQALFTTQMGLAVAVPGVVVGRLLDRRETSLALELAKIKDLLCAKVADRMSMQVPLAGEDIKP